MTRIWDEAMKLRTLEWKPNEHFHRKVANRGKQIEMLESDENEKPGYIEKFTNFVDEIV